MLPEHKNCVNGRNNQENKKIILDPIEKLSTQQQENNSPQNINDDDDNSTTTIINFQTQLTTTTNNHHDNINNDDNHITTLGGSTPKKNYFTTTNKIIKKKSISSTTKIHRSFGNRKNHQHQQQRHKNNRISCISFQDNFNDNQHHRRRGRRLNGLQLPLHPLQLFGWLILILFGLASFYILIPTFTIELQQPLYGLLGGLYIVHTISHLAAILIDPADCELRRIHRNDRIVPEFDRTKHSHVIENGRCHLCNIRTTSNRTKHCSVCNKCVGKFDHHCKWLNHCIGDRNYVAFLMCVVSAVIATLVILAAAIAQIVLFYINPLWLNLWYINGSYNNTIIDNNIENIIDTNTDIGISNHNQTIFSLNDSLILSTTSTTSIDDIYTNFIDDTLEIFNQTFDDDNDNSITNLTSIIAEAIVTEISNDTTSKQITINNIETTTIPTGISLHDTIFLIFTGVIGILAAITAGLLLHLCFFHIYISFLGLTTYEYIRNHRQNLATSNIPTNVPPPTSSNTTTNQSDPTLITSTSRRNSQIYFCSNLKHPNDLIINNLNTNSINNEHRPTTLHCCENSREYHQQTTSMKTIYMCSLLEESSSTTTTTNEHHHHHHHQHFRNGGGDGDMENSNNDKINKNNSKTFHCCSQFQKNQITNNDVADDNKVQRKRTTSAAAATILHFSEQCTFCTFRVKTPPPTTTTITKSIESIQDKRCCLKTITKHHRWRRKWNCCTNIPDSPDVPNDIISSISSTTTTIPTNNIPNSIFYQQQQQSYNNIHNNNSNLSSVINNPTQIPSHFIKTNGNNDNQQQQQSASSRIGLKTTRPKLVRPWPVTRFRHHMLRMIGRYRRPHCRHAIGINAINIGAVKQNQIRPLVNIQQQHQQQQQNNSSGDSSDTGSIGSDSTIQSIETILPTSVIRDGIYMTGELTMPVLPPPTRRKMANPTDLDELAETLGFTYTPSAQQQQQQQRFSNTNSIYRRQRRKHFLRTRSPTLSPIHESGLSNPTSPQPCRHVVSSCAGTIVNNSCGTSGSSVIISGGNSRYGKD